MQRGMVTVELAFAALGVMAGLVCAWWVIGGFLAFDQCQLTAQEVARQAVRGDDEGINRAIGQAPMGARVSVSKSSGRAVVNVEHSYRPVAWIDVPIVASSTVIVEP